MKYKAIFCVSFITILTTTIWTNSSYSINWTEEIQADLFFHDLTLSGDEYYDEYEIQVREGQRLIIDMTSTDFDTYIIYRDPSGFEAENDDYQDSTDHSYLEVTVRQSGTASIIATSYGPGLKGDYILRYGFEGGATTNYQHTQNRGSNIQVGRLTQSDETLSSGEYYHSYEIPLSQGANIVIDLESDDFDSYLIYQDPSGNQTDNDDIDDSSLNSHLDLVSQGTGTAIIYVTTYDPGETGNYTLRWNVQGSGSTYVAQNSQPAPAPQPTPQYQQTYVAPTPAPIPAPTPNNQVVAPQPVIPDSASLRLTLPRNIYAVIIGVGHYMDSNDFPELPYAVNDAQAIKNMLTDTNIIGVPETNIRMLLNEEATSRNIYAAVDEITRQASAPNTLVFFYFSGHGAPLTEGSGEVIDGVLVPYDAAINSLNRTGIPLSEFQQDINNLPSNCIVMLDSCFSGQGAVMPSSVRGLTVAPRQELIQSSFSNKVFITGSGNNQFSNDYPQEQHGLFTYFVLQGLGDKRADNDYDGYISMGELYNYLKINVSRISSSLTGYQEPTITGGGNALVINP